MTSLSTGHSDDRSRPDGLAQRSENPAARQRNQCHWRKHRHRVAGGDQGKQHEHRLVRFGAVLVRAVVEPSWALRSAAGARPNNRRVRIWSGHTIRPALYEVVRVLAELVRTMAAPLPPGPTVRLARQQRESASPGDTAHQPHGCPNHPWQSSSTERSLS